MCIILLSSKLSNFSETFKTFLKCFMNFLQYYLIISWSLKHTFAWGDSTFLASFYTFYWLCALKAFSIFICLRAFQKPSQAWNLADVYKVSFVTVHFFFSHALGNRSIQGKRRINLYRKIKITKQSWWAGVNFSIYRVRCTL